MDDNEDIFADGPDLETVPDPPGARNKDNTPSVLREVDSIVEPQPLAPRDSVIPVLAVPRSYIIWRRVKVILIIAAVVGILAAVGLTTRAYLAGKEVEKTVARALEVEAGGSVEDIEAADEMLTQLVDDYGERATVSAALAWLDVLKAIQFGPEEALAKKARASMRLARGDTSAVSAAAEAGLYYLGAKYKEAVELAKKSLEKYPGEPRLELVRALSLIRTGKQEKGMKLLQDAIAASPKYFPLVVSGVEAAIEKDDKTKGLALALTLRKSGPQKHLLESLATVAFSLNPWGGKDISKEQASKLEDLTTTLKSRIDNAPPKLKLLGSYVEGRVYLASNAYDKAIEAFERAAGENPTAAILVWYGLATKLGKGAVAALELIDRYPNVEDASMLDLKTSCLLECGRVEQAASTLKSLKATGALASHARALSFQLAVKRGDSNAAFKQLPKVVGEKKILTALELYFQLKNAGERKRIIKLANAFDDKFSSCAKAMRTWHSRKIGLAVKKLNADVDDVCMAALAGKLMLGKTDPKITKSASEKVASKTGAGLIFKVAQAMAVWLEDGRAEALKILDDIWAMKPEATPLKLAIASAYLDMDMPKKTIEVLEGVDDPDALAFSYLAAREVKGKKTDSIVAEATKKNASSPHPALALVIAHSQFLAGEYEDALRTVESVLPDAGIWTAELTEIGAKSINLFGDRKDADRLIASTAAKAGASAGVDEWWETKLTRARLNLYRGGKFVKRAKVMLDDLRKDGVVDGRLYYNLGIVELRKGKQDQAVGYIKKSIRLNPSLKAAYTQLKKLGELNGKPAATMKKVLPGFNP